MSGWIGKDGTEYPAPLAMLYGAGVYLWLEASRGEGGYAHECEVVVKGKNGRAFGRMTQEPMPEAAPVPAVTPEPTIGAPTADSPRRMKRSRRAKSKRSRRAKS